ncbi:hypothetical protein D6745_02850 [Candidatus Woesearchaeota archaeon]|nr:MAG: hypothetical protein D6745_02850 [Candidatus Woesearchaeota archaeon]
MGLAKDVATFTLGFLCGVYVGVGGCSYHFHRFMENPQDNVQRLQESYKDITDMIKNDPVVNKMKERIGEAKNYFKEKWDEGDSTGAR